MREHVSLRKRGKFYSAYEDDAYVIHAIMDYKVKSGRVGFPAETLPKVINELEECKVDYVIIENDREVDKKHFAKNNYFKFYKEGYKLCEKINREEDLIRKVESLSDDKINKIIKYIEEVCNE